MQDLFYVGPVRHSGAEYPLADRRRREIQLRRPKINEDHDRDDLTIHHWRASGTIGGHTPILQEGFPCRKEEEDGRGDEVADGNDRRARGVIGQGQHEGLHRCVPGQNRGIKPVF